MGSTSAHDPDSSAPRVSQEAARLIRIALHQLHAFLAQGETATNQLASAVGQLTAHLQREDTLPPHIEQAAQDAVMSMQFYDHLSQRLHHVTGGLELLAALLENDPLCQQSAAWPALHEAMKNLYSLADEKATLIELLEGTPPSQEDGDDIELF